MTDGAALRRRRGRSRRTSATPLRVSCHTVGFGRGAVFAAAGSLASGGGPCQTTLDKPSAAIYVQNLTSDEAVGHQQHHRLRDFLSQAYPFHG